MKTLNKLWIFFFAIILFFTSCSKDKTTDAPTPTITYSDWYTPPAYTKTTIYGTINFTADIAAPKVTQAILDGGTVLVYGKLNGYNPSIWPTDQVGQLPININYTSGNTPTLESWSAVSTAGNIKITFTSSINTYQSIATTHQFRYVIIPAGVRALSAINPNNYQQVQQALGIKN